jgi:membrane protein DedA with SNARE-associated domain
MSIKDLTYIKKNILILVQIILLITIVIVIYKFPFDYKKFAEFGYFGVFLTTLIGTAGLFFPVPNLLIIYGGGMAWNPFWIGLFGGIGSSIGELVGYMFGNRTSLILESKNNLSHQQRITNKIKKYGFWAIFFFSAIPNPIFDFVGISAGFLKYKTYRFFLACLLGRLLRSFLFSYLGYWGIIHYNI